MLSMLCDSSNFLVLFFSTEKRKKNDANGKQGLRICFKHLSFSVYFFLFENFFHSVSPVFLFSIGCTEASWINPDVMHK